jgi:hypothetical protein
MQDNNISSFDELQDVYMNNIISILKNSNKLTAAWNEAALPPHNDIGSAGSAGKVDKSCIIFAWEHPDVGLCLLKKDLKLFFVLVIKLTLIWLIITLLMKEVFVGLPQ